MDEMTEKQDLMTILIQTGFNLERMVQDKAIKKEAYIVLKHRNDLAIAELKGREADSSHDNSGLNIPTVNNLVCPTHGIELYKHPNGMAYCSLCNYSIQWQTCS